jgi:hypothetical protein
MNQTTNDYVHNKHRNGFGANTMMYGTNELSYGLTSLYERLYGSNAALQTNTGVPSNVMYGGFQPQQKKTFVGSSAPESLLSMALYDLEPNHLPFLPAGMGTATGNYPINHFPHQQQPQQPRFQGMTGACLPATTSGSFHPVEDYKDLTLREILDLSDDFLFPEDQTPPLGNDTYQSGMHKENVDRPYLATSDSTLRLNSVDASTASFSDSPYSVLPSTSNLEEYVADVNVSGAVPSAISPKKRVRDDHSQFLDEDEDDCEDGSDKDGRRFRPYQAGQWAEKFEELCHYRQENGHCLVPHTYGANLALARWVKRQRYQYKLMVEGKQSTMTPERVTALEDIGFVWDSQGAAWAERLQELAVFHSTFRHCNVPSNYHANPQLATWVKCQRRQYKLHIEGKPSNMTSSRVRELESLGFEWELRAYKKSNSL